MFALPFTTVRIVGPSMEPALVNGDAWLVRTGARFVPGDVVLARHPQRPELLIVKRLAHRINASESSAGWWVTADNLAQGEGSESFGPVREILGKLVLRYARG